MNEKKESIFETGEFIFYHAINELSYIKKSIKLIEKNLTSSLSDLYIEYEEELKKQYKEESYGLEIDKFAELFMPNIDNSTNILSTINESILIKIYSIFEKAVILFAYELQKYYECKIPPHFNRSKNKYTDIESAKDYIHYLSNFDLSKLETWEAIVKLRNIRNRLSHGNTLLKIEETQVNQINIEFQKNFNKSNIPLLIKVKDEKNKYRINDDIKVLYIARDLIAKTIIILNINYTKMRIRDDKFKLDDCLYGEGATKKVLEIYNK